MADAHLMVNASHCTSQVRTPWPGLIKALHNSIWWGSAVRKPRRPHCNWRCTCAKHRLRVDRGHAPERNDANSKIARIDISYVLPTRGHTLLAAKTRQELVGAWRITSMLDWCTNKCRCSPTPCHDCVAETRRWVLSAGRTAQLAARRARGSHRLPAFNATRVWCVSRQKARIFSTLSDTGNPAPATLSRVSLSGLVLTSPQLGVSNGDPTSTKMSMRVWYARAQPRQVHQSSNSARQFVQTLLRYDVGGS